MPFLYGAGAYHDDTQHYGSAKRDTVSGVAGLDSTGHVLGKSSRVLLNRDGSNFLGLRERTANENCFHLERIAANDYNGYIIESNVAKQIQTASMKDVASGIVGLDTNVDIPHIRPKAASANLRHSHDAEVSTVNAAYVKLKTLTFALGIKGTLRISFDLESGDGVTTAYGRVYKNGAVLGTEQSTTSGAYVTKTEDVVCGVLAPNDTLELWLRCDGVVLAYARNFRISYDNAADVVLVDGVTAT